MLGRFRFRRRAARELAPDEVFLDASNLPDFDRGRLEGRLERPLSEGTHLMLSLGAAALLGVLFLKAGALGIVDGGAYAAQSERNRLRSEVVFAERGAILDRNGTVLVGNDTGASGFPVRTYAAPGFAHVLGYVSYPKKDSSGNYYDTEIRGLAGAELAFDERLAGENGTLLVEEDARGETASQGAIVPARAGETLTLSLDTRAQEALFSTLRDVVQDASYQGGAGVLMDVDTGEIIALASYPEYDPNVLSRGTPADVIAGYDKDPRRPYLNRAVAGLYTPGSIVKPMIAAGALMDGIIAPGTEIVSTGQLVVPNPYNPDQPTVFRDWKVHGATDMREAISVSSDVYFYTVGGGFGNQKGLGIERLAHWYRTFGFESATGIELPGEASGFIPTPEWKEETYGDIWRIGNTYHTAIGQYAMQVTLLEAARATAAIANNGRLVQPTILKGGAPGGTTLAVDREALRVVREGMRLAVAEGTAAGLAPYAYAAPAAKTGTAELGINNEYRNSWLVGFFPHDAPKYAFAIVLERGPGGTTTGGVYVMARVFEKLRQTAPEYFGLAPEERQASI